MARCDKSIKYNVCFGKSNEIEQTVILKTGNKIQLEQECLADAIYNSIGVPVPRSHMSVMNSGEICKVSEYISGRLVAPNEYWKVRSFFVVDCLMSNWDVCGLDIDNMLITDDGTVYRIDNGGSLCFRAQGDLKKPSFLGRTIVEELQTMRNADINPSAYAVFGQMSDDEVCAQIRSLHTQIYRSLYLFEKEHPLLIDTLRQRLTSMVNWTEIMKQKKESLYDLMYKEDQLEAFDQFNKRPVELTKFIRDTSLPEGIQKGVDYLITEANKKDWGIYFAMAYQGGLYSIMTRYLLPQKATSSDYFLDFVVKQMDSLFDRIPCTTKEMIVFRGMSREPNFVTPNYIHFQSYSSVSLSEEVALDYTADPSSTNQMQAGQKTIFKIVLPVGTAVVPVCALQNPSLNDELEVILQRNCTLKVIEQTRKKIGSGKYVQDILYISCIYWY